MLTALVGWQTGCWVNAICCNINCCITANCCCIVYTVRSDAMVDVLEFVMVVAVGTDGVLVAPLSTSVMSTISCGSCDATNTCWISSCTIFATVSRFYVSCMVMPPMHFSALCAAWKWSLKINQVLMSSSFSSHLVRDDLKIPHFGSKYMPYLFFEIVW